MQRNDAGTSVPGGCGHHSSDRSPGLKQLRHDPSRPTFPKPFRQEKNISGAIVRWGVTRFVQLRVQLRLPTTCLVTIFRFLQHDVDPDSLRCNTIVSVAARPSKE